MRFLFTCESADFFSTHHTRDIERDVRKEGKEVKEPAENVSCTMSRNQCAIVVVCGNFPQHHNSVSFQRAISVCHFQLFSAHASAKDFG